MAANRAFLVCVQSVRKPLRARMEPFMELSRRERLCVRPLQGERAAPVGDSGRLPAGRAAGDMGCCRTPDFAVAFCQEAGVRHLTCGAQAIDEVGLALAAFHSDGESILCELVDPVRTPEDGDSSTRVFWPASVPFSYRCAPREPARPA